MNTTGQDLLDDCCPICLHEPIQKQDCKPNKSLRTTIRAFLKKKVMEKENAKKKQMLAKKPPPSAAPALLETTNSEVSQLNPVVEAGSTLVPIAKDGPEDTSRAPSAAPAEGLERDGQQTPSDGQKDIPRPSIEVISSLAPIHCGFANVLHSRMARMHRVKIRTVKSQKQQLLVVSKMVVREYSLAKE